jgi:aconitate decarboxylase
MRELKRRGLSPANLERLTIRMSKKGWVNIGWPYQPGEIITAQMNGYYAAAVTLIDGEAFIDQYTEDRLADPKILALLPRIEIIHDPDLDRGGAAKRHAVKIDAALKDGNILSTYVEQRRGSADHPLSAMEIEQKFNRLAADFLSQAAIGELIELVAQLELQRDMNRLVELITTSRKARNTA